MIVRKLRATARRHTSPPKRHASTRGNRAQEVLKLERLERGRMKQLVKLHQRRRESLLVVLREEILELLAVGWNTVGPEIRAHEVARGLHLLLHERQRDLAGRGVFEQGEANGFCARKRLQERGRQPWVLRDERAANADH